ncbi:hypothetical protein M9Y10_021451 [Tritrichomonas musculus]|uniref:Clan CD, family C13, asparaginyl endopeptidase-like cysteine peptidase n=1 Tax=Tritrichomonas musculus TaxID=1915356 RepID=A0ABR2HDZ0_9EUKA
MRTLLKFIHTLDHKFNVYPGSYAINVKTESVTDQAFYDAITNLPTSSDDYVFIYYDNHGGTGVLGTPTNHYIHADTLNEALNSASSSKLYKQCLFIIEACYSGSVAEFFTAPNLATITTANSVESSYAAVYDTKLGTYISNEFTNYFIELIDEKPSISIGELYNTLKQETVQSHVCFYGDESIQSVSLSTFIGTPNRIISHKVDKSNIKLVKPRDATFETLEYLSNHEKASVRSRARLQILRLKAQTEKLEAVLELLVKYVDPQNYEKIMNDTESKITSNYFQVLDVFFKQFGEINPDDYGRLNVLKALASKHSKAEIVQGIFAVIY